MIEKPEEDFDGDEDDAVTDADDPGLDHLLDDFDNKRRKGAPRAGEPALRRLERRREEQETAALLSDIDDYDIDEPGAARRRRR